MIPFLTQINTDNADKDLIQTFNDHGNSLPSADAGCRQAIFLLAAVQFVEQRDYEPSSGCAQGMSEGDGPAVHIDFVAIEAEFLFDSKILRGEGFIDFDQVNVVESQPSFLQSDFRGWNR